MKLVILLALALTSNAFASVSIFSCKETAARSATAIAVNPAVMALGNIELLRDNKYVPGNNGKSYYRYSNEMMDVLVPKLMAKNQTNQGVIIVFTAQEKIRLSCVK